MSSTDLQKPAGQDDDKEEGSPLGTLLSGVGALALAGFLFYQFTTMEEGGGSIRVWWPIALAYNLGGKWPPVVLIVLVGLGLIAFGIKGLLVPKKPAV